VPAAKPDGSQKSWLVQLSWLMAGVAFVGLAAVAGSVRFVRVTAAGHMYAESDVPAAPVALVLGAKVFPDGTPSPFLTGRLDLAKRLYDAGRVEMIMVSGDSQASEFDEPSAMRDYLIHAGVPASHLVVDETGFDTFESCLRARRIFNGTRLIMVTQSYHLPRAVATCRALGLDAIGVGDDSARQHPNSWRRGVIRDQFACLKTVIDLVRRGGSIQDERGSATETISQYHPRAQ
jgi:vancomycin permeability regulator SanA